jgi:copper resistance protein C
MRKPFNTLVLAAAVVLMTGMMHNHLLKSSPSDGEELQVAPKEIRLWFNERPEIPFTSASLLRADSTKIATVRAVPAADSMVADIPLTMTLVPGKYFVAWRTASSDGHAIRGSFGFSIAP